MTFKKSSKIFMKNTINNNKMLSSLNFSKNTRGDYTPIKTQGTIVMNDISSSFSKTAE
jgi:hypothetical protein